MTSFAPLWSRGLPFLARTSSKKAVGSSNALFITVAMVTLSYFVDSTVSGLLLLALLLTLDSLLILVHRVDIGGISRSGYLFLLLHLLLCGQRSEILASQPGDEQVKAKMHANGVIFSTIVSIALSLVQGVFVSTPVLDTLSHRIESCAKSGHFLCDSFRPKHLVLLLPCS